MSNPKRDDMTEVDVETGNGWDFQSNGREMNDSSAIHHSSQRPDPSHRENNPQTSKITPTVELLASTGSDLSKWTDRARWFTGFAMLVSLVSGVLALVAGGLIHSAALVGFGLEALVDMAASVFVLWRFWNKTESASGQRANEDRELRANVCIAFIFVIVSVITCINAIDHLAKGRRPENSGLIIAFSVVTMLLLGSIGTVKLWLNTYIHSKALQQDAMASFATAAMSVGIFISALTYTLKESIWWFDAVVAIVVTVALAAYSLPVLVKNRWWHKSFWKSWSTDSDS